MVQNIVFKLPPLSRGYHLVTEHIFKQIGKLPENGMLNLYISHTSAGLTVNENADISVRIDLEYFLDKLAPERDPYYSHTLEGDDDMPAHIKAFLTGSSIQIPIVNSKPALGTWQGIYLCEFRNRVHQREVIASIIT